MMQTTTPALYYPSICIVIDDDEIYGENLARIISLKTPAIFCSPDKALKMTNQELLYVVGKKSPAVQLPNTNEWKDVINFFKSDNSSEVISCIISDHCMKPINGIDLCRKFSKAFAPKFLITNFPDLTNAKEAQNNGVINAFYAKNEKDFFTRITDAAVIAKHTFFSHLSRSFPKYFSADNPLLEDGISSLLNKIIEKYHAPYYELDPMGQKITFFSHNKEKRATMLILKESTVESILSDGVMAETAPKSILNVIRAGKMLPWHKDGAYCVEGKNWMNSLKPANKFKGKHEYVYSISEE